MKFATPGRTAAYVAAVAGFGARVYVAAHSVGCNDMSTWEHFARLVNAHGIGHVYDIEPMFNHPPLMGLMAAVLARWAAAVNAPFPFVFKLPAILADVLTAALVHAYVARRSSTPRGSPQSGGGTRAAVALAVFAWSLPSILITAYHGNTDSICAAFALLAAVLVDRGRPALGGAALGAAINVKLIPVLLIPLLASVHRSPRQLARFVAGLSAGVLPFVPLVVWHWPTFSAHVLGYRSNYYQWGSTFLLAKLSDAPQVGAFFARLDEAWIRVGAYAIIAAVCALAVVSFQSRRFGAVQLTACVFAIFLALAPGWGVQYLVYIVGALIAVDVVRGAVYSAVAGAGALLLYMTSWTGQRPWYSFVPSHPPIGVLAVCLCAWVVVVHALVGLLAAPRDAPLAGAGARASTRAHAGAPERSA